MYKNSSMQCAIYFGLATVFLPFFAGNAYGQLDPQPLTIVKGVYRLPYADGTDVRFSNNHTNHPASLHRVDMTGRPPFPTQQHVVVAAAAGWIRLIAEGNDTKCPDSCGPNNDCDGNGVTTVSENNQAQTNACGGYAGPSTFCCETDFEANGGTCPTVGTATGTCTGNPNNFVWIEHPNGEWTKYSHMLRGSVGPGTDVNGNPGQGHVVDDWVNAGDVLGLEGDVGFASGVHIHFEVAVPNYVELTDELDALNLTEADPERPTPLAGDLIATSGFLFGDNVQDDVIFEDPDGDGINNPDDDVNRQNRIAVFCQVGFPIIANEPTAGPCDDLCNNLTLDVVGTIAPADTPLYEQVVNDIGNMTGNLTIDPFAGVSFRSAGSVTLSPGFHADGDSFFVASIGSCDSPGGTGE